MSDHNCVSIMAATSAMVTSIALSTQSDAFKCKSASGNSLIIGASVIAFVGFNAVHNPKLAPYASKINQALICMPPILHTLTDMHNCPARSAADYSQALNWVSIFTTFAVPLVVYHITATDSFRTMVCNFYEKKNFGVYHLGKKPAPVPAKDLLGDVNAKPVSMTSIDEARERAMNVLKRAMDSIKDKQ